MEEREALHLPDGPEALHLPDRLIRWAPARAFSQSDPPGLGLAELRSLHGRVVPGPVAAQYAAWVSRVVQPEMQGLWHRYCLRRVSGAPAGCTLDARGSIVGALMGILAIDKWLGPGDAVDMMKAWLTAAMYNWSPQKEMMLEKQTSRELYWQDPSHRHMPKVGQTPESPLDVDIAVLEKQKTDALQRCRELEKQLAAAQKKDGPGKGGQGPTPRMVAKRNGPAPGGILSPLVSTGVALEAEGPPGAGVLGRSRQPTGLKEREEKEKEKEGKEEDVEARGASGLGTPTGRAVQRGKSGSGDAPRSKRRLLSILLGVLLVLSSLIYFGALASPTEYRG